MPIVKGRVEPGNKGATRRMPEVIDLICKLTGYPNLQIGTLNVRLDHPHKHRADFTLLGRDWPKPDPENWFFEECKISRGGRTLEALILKTTADYCQPGVHGLFGINLSKQLGMCGRQG
jgi:hypothetical protein